MRRFKDIGIDNWHIGFARNVHKSVRMGDRIYKYIMRFEGSDFADKLENLVIHHARLTNMSADLIH